MSKVERKEIFDYLYSKWKNTPKRFNWVLPKLWVDFLKAYREWIIYKTADLAEQMGIRTDLWHDPFYVTNIIKPEIVDKINSFNNEKDALNRMEEQWVNKVDAKEMYKNKGNETTFSYFMLHKKWVPYGWLIHDMAVITKKYSESVANMLWDAEVFGSMNEKRDALMRIARDLKEWWKLVPFTTYDSKW
jgi:hypothetical protein